MGPDGFKGSEWVQTPKPRDAVKQKTDWLKILKIGQHIKNGYFFENGSKFWKCVKVLKMDQNFKMGKNLTNGSTFEKLFHDKKWVKILNS